MGWLLRGARSAPKQSRPGRRTFLALTAILCSILLAPTACA